MIKSKLILLVEDNPDDEAMTLFALQNNDIPSEVIVKRDGAEALDYLFAEKTQANQDSGLMPGLILLDLKLPKINGIEVLRRIREHPRTELLPVVMMTTSIEEQDRLRSYQLCANSFIQKPVDFDQFVEMIRHIERYWLEINVAPPFRN